MAMSLGTTVLADDNAIVNSGTCGKNLTWTLDSAGLLTISGTGEMWDSAFSYNKDIKSVRLPDAITQIPYKAFSGCTNLKNIRLPDSVTQIDEDAFGNCDLQEQVVQEIVSSDNITFIGSRAFEGNKNIYTVHIGKNVEYIQTETFNYMSTPSFHDCTNLTSITVSPENQTYTSINGLLCSKDGRSLLYVPVGISGRLDVPAGIETIGREAMHYAFSIKIVHIPKILCHSMKAENLITEEQEKKNWEAGRKALEEHYRRAEVPATAELADKKGWYRSHLTISGEPMISVIIPSKDHINDLELCISSIEEKTTWKNYEIIIVENNSVEKETFVYYETLKNRYPNVRILTWKKEFNYSAINNFAVREARGEYLLFLNNDVEIITENWLEEMLQLCQQKDVGMVGAKLYYPDDTIQHAGVVVGLGGVAAHVLCKLPRDAEGYMGRLRCVQEISAVTAACMMVKTSVFKAVGGFDEELKVAFNDIDLCMKVRKYGVKIVFTPYAELYHYESKSRGMEDTPEKQLRFSREVNCFRRKWERELLKGDPYYNPNLTLNNTDCSLRKQEKNGD